MLKLITQDLRKTKILKNIVKTRIKVGLLVTMQILAMTLTIQFVTSINQSQDTTTFVQQTISQIPTNDFSQNEKFNFKTDYKKFSILPDMNFFALINIISSIVMVFGIIKILKTETRKKIQGEKLTNTEKLASLESLIESCNNMDPKKLCSIDTDVSDEFQEIRNAINNMIERIYHNEEKINKYQIEMTVLNKKIESQNRGLAKQLDKIKDVEIKKDEFSTMVTHELKTPLSPIMTWCGLLLEPDMMGELNLEQRNAVEKIESNTEKLNQLIGDILDAQKIDMQQVPFTYEFIEISTIGKEIHEQYRNIMANAKVEFDIIVKEKINVKVDLQRLEQILMNFINNALDFVPKNNGRIQLIIKKEGKNVKFSVIDNGKGISKDTQKNIFKKFYQVDTSITRKHGGSGLGLAICKGLVEGLGGEIGVKSETGIGSEFYFYLPQENVKQEQLDEISSGIIT